MVSFSAVVIPVSAKLIAYLQGSSFRGQDFIFSAPRICRTRGGSLHIGHGHLLGHHGLSLQHKETVMPDFAPSLATEDDVTAYSTADSHLLAVALHRHFGWHILVVTDSIEPFWVDAEEPENNIPAVVHVFAVDDKGDLWDVLGRRPRTEMHNDLYERYNTLDFGTDHCDGEEDLAAYVGYWADRGEPISRPLSPYGDDGVAAAGEVIARIFPGLPSFSVVPQLAP
jgi:hypothetical protein